MAVIDADGDVERRRGTARRSRSTGIDQQVVFRTLFLSTTNDDVALEAALLRAYNSFMAEACARSGGRVARGLAGCSEWRIGAKTAQQRVPRPSATAQTWIERKRGPQ